ncbi:hypothetical protein LGH70_21760 [Hymenobacter sp. BT635]|uniref:Antitoxin VbhA domain-containing protein n=1 Tax=Hymenobacter nitidus TaxID=2880929 RepID=A0ABS8AIG5_9BACT|nr:hypothetical protein [Hymenobacter nitidus]MCB2380233.1 hypothetical protein [Hymenobacter nitidus]
MLAPTPFNDPGCRQKAVAFALALTQKTPLEPGAWERAQLRLFETGELSLDELEARLEPIIHEHDPVG